MSHKPVPSGAVYRIPVWAQNFIGSCRDQGYLLPPDVRDWLAADHLAWFVIDAVAQIDLAGVYRAYRADGHGAAAYEPSMMAQAQPVVATVDW
jgi:hypothetical protein